VTDYVRDNPDLAPLIREFLPGLLLLEELGRYLIDAPLSSPAAGAPSLAPKEIGRLGEFRVLREIGRGGMGVVYEAIQDPLKRRVALKILPFHALAGEGLLERFKIEAQVAAKLDHPHIVPVYGFGTIDNIHYYSMQYIPGQGLDKVLEEVTRIRSSGGRTGGSSAATPLALKLLTDRFDPSMGEDGPPGSSARGVSGSEPEVPSEEGSSGGASELIPITGDQRAYRTGVVRIGKDVARALDHAHERGILHRDIKPSNILLDTRGRTWVTDFGLAKEIGEKGLTRSGEVLGTLRYMAPERFDGVSDPRSDVYSLGVTLYELLALRPAFEEKDRNRLARAILEEEPPSLRAIDPKIPRDLEQIVMAAMQKDPGNRYQRAGALANDLDRFTRGMPIAIKPPSLGYRLKHAAKRRPVVAASSALVLLLALGFLAWLFVAANRGRGPTWTVVDDFDGNGIPDVAASNVLTNNLSILLNPRSGSARVALIPLGEYPYSLAARDLTGNGRIDVVACNYRSRNISIVTNREGGFVRREAIDLPEPPMTVDAADFDGDSRIDLAVCGGAQWVWVLKNMGDRFSEPAAFEIAKNPLSVVAVDYDGDGDFDLCAASASPESISILANDGRGAFVPAPRPKAAGFALRLAFAHLDDDGAPDMASVNLPASMAVYLNRRDGSFAPPSVYHLQDDVQIITAGDFDGDGKVDLVAVGGEHNVVLLRNEGGGVLAAPLRMRFGDKPSHVLSTDWNEDTRLDLLITNFGSHDISVLLNDGTCSFHEERRLGVSRW
jgi:serine/threonine protein kinase